MTIDDLKLISLVERNRLLYDKTRCDFRNKEKQENVWHSIANILETDVEEVKSRWRSIRQRYSKEKLRITSSGSDVKDDSVEWKCWKYLGFLETVVRPRNILMAIDDLKLISLVERNRLLYDKTRSDFRNKEKHENVWHSIANILEADVEEVKIRWRSIRQRYSKEKLRINPSGSDVENNSTEWKLWKYLGFLETVVRPRKAVSKKSKAAFSRYSSSKEATTWDSMSKIAPVESQSHEDVHPRESTPTSTPVEYFHDLVTIDYLEPEPESDRPLLVVRSAVGQGSSAPRSNSCTPESPRPKKAKKTESRENRIETVLDHIGNALKKESSFDNYGRWIASALAEMPREEAKRKQRKINEIILE